MLKRPELNEEPVERIYLLAYHRARLHGGVHVEAEQSTHASTPPTELATPKAGRQGRQQRQANKRNVEPLELRPGDHVQGGFEDQPFKIERRDSRHTKITTKHLRGTSFEVLCRHLEVVAAGWRSTVEHGHKVLNDVQ